MIPKRVLGKTPKTPAEFKAQQDRIAAYIRDKLAEPIENHANKKGDK